MAKQIKDFAPKERTINRPGVHAKTKSSTNKKSKNYRKKYRGQGK